MPRVNVVSRTLFARTAEAGCKGPALVVAAGLALAAGLQPVEGTAAAPDYPSRPIRMVVPFSPGGTSDTLARILGQKLSEAWGQPVVVDARPGASGIIGTEIAMRAPADGHTLMHGNMSQFAINPALHAKLPYDTQRDFAPVSLVAMAPQLVVVPPSLPVASVRELVDHARARREGPLFGSGGSGTLAYVGGEMFNALAGTRMVHVPYKGTVLALNDLVAGQVQVLFSDMPIALAQVRAGKLRALAVTSAQRTSLVPGVPTVAESGLPGYSLVNWWGILAPRGLPPAVLARLHAALVRIHELPEVRERYAGLGVDAASSPSPAAFADFIAQEAARYGPILRKAGAKAD
jgi:tripartite-type tricarboxylate transporter receptor subunit TctC